MNDAVGEPWRVQQLQPRLHGPLAGLHSRVHKPGNASVQQRSCAHGTGLDSHVQRGAQQAVVSNGARGRSQADDFGMGCRILAGTGPIVPPTKASALCTDQHRADGNLTRCLAASRLCQRDPHPAPVGFSKGRVGHSGSVVSQSRIRRRAEPAAQGARGHPGGCLGKGRQHLEKADIILESAGNFSRRARQRGNLSRQSPATCAGCAGQSAWANLVATATFW